MKALLLAALTASGIGCLTMPASAVPAGGLVIKEAADTVQLAQDVWYPRYRFYRPYYSYYYRPYYYRPYYRPFAFYHRPYYRPFYGHYGYRRW
jgi:hypothetical protein